MVAHLPPHGNVRLCAMLKYVRENGRDLRRNSMPRLDLMCKKCEHIVEDIIVEQKQLKNGTVRGPECPACDNDVFSVYWGNGQAPRVVVNTNDPESLFDRCKTIGEYWDRRGLEVGGKKNIEANKARVKRMRNKKK